MRRVILHPPTLSRATLSLRPFGSPRDSGTGPASRTAADRVNRNCHLSSQRFTIPFTPAAVAATISGPFRDILKFRSDSSARDRSYILAGDSAAHHAPFYRSRYLRFFASSSHFASRKLRAALVELSLPKLRYRDYFLRRTLIRIYFALNIHNMYSSNRY